MDAPEKRNPKTGSPEDLTSKTISHFGEQWVHYRDNPGYYGSVELLKDLVEPLLPLDFLHNKDGI